MSSPVKDLLLRAVGVVKHSVSVEALRGADFDVYPSEVVALVGDNGAGKSTLVKIFSGILAPDEGAIQFEGNNVAIAGPVMARKLGIETVYQERQQGFEQAIKEFDGIDYLGAEYSNNDPAKAASIVTSTLAAEPDLTGIFATNLFSAEGSATGLRNEGSLGDVKIVGFDASPSQVAQLEEGLVQALVVQQPREIGRLGVEQAVADLKGEEVTPEIATKVVVATEKNLDHPAIADSLYTDEC